MGIVTKPNTYSPGTTITASDVNSNEDTLYTLVNGSLDNDNIDASANIAVSKISGTGVNLATAQTLQNKTLSTGTKVDGNADQSVTSHSMFRQALLNGNFDVWQRGTSFTPAASATYTADMWKIQYDEDGGTLPTDTISRQDVTPDDIDFARYHWRLNVDGTGSGFGANAIYGVLNRIEHGTRYLCGDSKTVTVSFYAKSDIVGKKIGVYMKQAYGTSGSPTSTEIIAGEDIDLTSSWVKYTHTFTTNTLSGKTFGTDDNDYLEFGLLFQWGATTGNNYLSYGTAETFVGSGNIDISQVQICEGSNALVFTPKRYEEELKSCQRFYETGAIGNKGGELGILLPVRNTTAGNKIASHSVEFKVTKQTTPTISYTDAWVYEQGSNTNRGASPSTLAADLPKNGFVAYVTDNTNFATDENVVMGFEWEASIDY